MQAILDFLGRHGYWFLFLTVLAEQLGLPIPAVPVLVAVGALAGAGQLSVWTCLIVAVVACLISDTFWFWLGRRKGISVLKTLCRISLEPDSCVSIARDWFRRMGSSALLLAKFVPGFSTAAPPMAGVTGMPLWRFLVFDGLGSLAWAGAAVAGGWLFRDQLERVLEALNRLGSWLGAVVAGALALYVSVKWYQRHRLIHSFMMARISPEELFEKQQAGELVTIVDLRGALEIGEIGTKIPGAEWYAMSELEHWHTGIPRDREIILYCS